MDNGKIVGLIIAAIIALLLLAFVCVGLIHLYKLNKAIAKARKKCDEYVEKTCDQSIPKNMPPSTESSPVLGGEPVPIGKIPHMAFIGQHDTEREYWPFYCGGSLISEYFVMTAAHCWFNRTEYKNDMFVRLGTTNTGYGTEFNITEIYVHPNFDFNHRSAYVYDIALMKLGKKVEFNWKIKPICLNTDFDSISKEDITAPGWGSNEKNVYQQENLQTVDLNIDEDIQTECEQNFGAELVSQMVCAGHLTEHKSSCSGDSGGPLQILLKNGCPNTYEQIGIASFILHYCTNDTVPFLGMYTKVQNVLTWIVPIVWPD